MPDYTPPLKTLICQNMGYCCMFCFFSLYHSPGVIALRLGCTRQAVGRHKRKWREGEHQCTGAPNCMRQALVKAGKL